MWAISSRVSNLQVNAENLAQGILNFITVKSLTTYSH